MYWRKDPKAGGTFSGPPDWPRNGAILKGVEHDVKGARWLEVQEYKPNGSAPFEKTPGCWMPFDQVRHCQLEFQMMTGRTCLPLTLCCPTLVTSPLRRSGWTTSAPLGIFTLKFPADFVISPSCPRAAPTFCSLPVTLKPQIPLLAMGCSRRPHSFTWCGDQCEQMMEAAPVLAACCPFNCASR
jgi:hypothetical protein